MTGKRGSDAPREMYAVGVDIGGTFTDIVGIGEKTGRVCVAKVLTDYGDLAHGVITGIRQMLAQHGLEPGAVSRVVHGTTLVTNSLIERRGARTALVVTAGFGDVLELGRESRYDIYDIDLDIPAPLVPRELTFEVAERMDFRGEVVNALSDAAIDTLVEALTDAGVESVAVCLLHAYANPAHEQRIAAALAERLPGIAVSLSSEVMPDLREYERASTTAANAYVRPVVQAYLDRLARALADLGIAGGLAIVTSDGGLVDVSTAARFPVRLTESGPAGGATAAAYLSRGAGAADVIAYDMGGTTAKICVIENAQPLTANTFEFGRVYRFARGSGLPLQIPVIEMIEIGAGGGSIAHMNDLDMLQIGPESANADPGPACYGGGGTAATVTDADLVLGYLDADSFLGGAMRLDVGRAREAIERSVARPLRQTIEEAAYSIHRVVNANMARAAKVHCLEQGKDPRRFALFAYGGAGPVHAYGVAQTLGMREIVFPPRAGVMSAVGFLVAKPSFEVLRGRISPLLGADVSALNALLKDMEEEAASVVRVSAARGWRLSVVREVAVRYEGQSYELYVRCSNRPLDSTQLKAIARNFLAAYAERYHAAAEENRLEAVRWRVRVVAEPPQPVLELAPRGARGSTALKGRRKVYVPERRRMMMCPVYDRYALGANARIAGPAIVEEAESTVYLGRGAVAKTTSGGELRVVLPQRQAARRRVEEAR